MLERRKMFTLSSLGAIRVPRLLEKGIRSIGIAGKRAGNIFWPVRYRTGKENDLVPRNLDSLVAMLRHLNPTFGKQRAVRNRTISFIYNGKTYRWTVRQLARRYGCEPEQVWNRLGGRYM